ncbi:MAG: lamin tail domain-containing protein [Deltaproteobacteria bacterium]|nr:lamin tail domain-containing protein [Deltaproteobacteria bacterium]
MRQRLASMAAVVLFALGASAQAQPIITEIFYNPPGTEGSFEWFEIYNPGPGELALAGMVVESRVATNPRLGNVPAGASALAAGSYAVLAKSALLGTNCRTAGVTIVLEGDFGLNNSNDTGVDNPRIALFPPGTTDVVNTTPWDIVGYRESGFSAAADAQTLQLVDTGADNYIGSNWSLSPLTGCQPWAISPAGPLYGNPGRENTWCYRGLDAGLVEDGGTSSGSPVCLPPPDGGYPDTSMPDRSGGIDAGPGVDVPGYDLVPIDAGPQNPPSIAVSQPAGAVVARPSVEIVYSASDPDNDPLTVALLYDTDASGNDGVLIADGLDPVGSHTWTPAGVPAGSYRILGRALDARGGIAYAYAAGSVTVEAQAVTAPLLTIVKPDGNEGEIDAQCEIVFTHNNVAGTVSLYYDTDSSGENGQPIVGGLAVPGGPTRVSWDTRAVASGSYYVYGRYQTSSGAAVSYSAAAVTIRHANEGCGCEQRRPPAGTWIGLLLVTFLALLARRFAALR